MITGISFLSGGIAFFFINKKLDREKRRENRIKYFFYLVIVLVVLGSIFLSQKIFIALIIIINSLGILEMMKIATNVNGDHPAHYLAQTSRVVYMIVLLFFLVFALLPQLFIAYTYTVVMLFDAASQISGQLFGKKKIAPQTSPGKTLEGFIGGFVIAILCSVLLHRAPEISVTESVIYGTIICTSAFTGDLLASLYKRKFGVKNFSNLIPGHGGIFDRFDSFIAAGAVISIFKIKYLLLNTPGRDMILYLVTSFLFLLVLMIGEVIYLRFRMKPEYTRMAAHFTAGMICLFILPRFSSQLYVLALCIQSSAFLYLAREWELFSSHNQVARKTYGSPLFFAGIIISFYSYIIMQNIAFFVLPVTVLTVSDPLAALTGMTIKSGKGTKILILNTGNKTYLGSFLFLVSSFLIFFFGLQYYYNLDLNIGLILALILSCTATFTEAVSSYGSDNISVPVIILVLLYLAKSAIL